MKSIVICGEPGVNKQRVGTTLSRMYGMPLFDAGALYATLAEENGLTMLEQMKNGSRDVDATVESRIREYAAKGKPMIYVSDTAWNFVPNAIVIYIVSDICRFNVSADVWSKLKINQLVLDRLAEAHYSDLRYIEMYGITRKQCMERADIILNVGRGVYGCIRSLSNLIDHWEEKVYAAAPATYAPIRVCADYVLSEVEYDSLDGDVTFFDGHTIVTRERGFIADMYPCIRAMSDGTKLLCTTNFTVIPDFECPLKDYELRLWDQELGTDYRDVLISNRQRIWSVVNAPERFTDFGYGEIIDLMSDEYKAYVNIN